MEWKTFSWQKHVDKTRNTLFPHEVVYCGRKSVYRFGNKADIDKYLNRLSNVYKKTNAKKGSFVYRLRSVMHQLCPDLHGTFWWIVAEMATSTLFRMYLCLLIDFLDYFFV